MPGLDGYEVCRRLKEDPRTASVPVIFISVLDDERDTVEAFDAGAVDFVTKPFQPQEVLARVRTHLRLRELTERLEQKVTERTQELAVANARLQGEIAERVRAEDAVRRLNQELEQRVLERTAQFETANQELEAFAYSVSHDLRAPLRHVAGYLELLAHRLGPAVTPKARHYLAQAIGAAEHMGTLVDDLLSFSRMGREKMSREQVDLGALVTEIVAELEPEARERVVHWRIGALPAVRGDRALLRVVLVNLLSNALKFTRPRAEARIEVTAARGPAGEQVVSVRDNGVGFDPAYVDRLFEVFQRLHRAEEFDGTGIGLATVRRIVARHGGLTWAEGSMDQGATFSFSLPAPVAAAHRNEPAAQA